MGTATLSPCTFFGGCPRTGVFTCQADQNPDGTGVSLTVTKNTCSLGTKTVECPQTSSNQGQTYAVSCSSGGQVEEDATSCLFPAGREPILMGTFQGGPPFTAFATCTTGFGQDGNIAPIISQTLFGAVPEDNCIINNGFCTSKPMKVTATPTFSVQCPSGSEFRIGTIEDRVTCLGIEPVGN